MKKSDSAIKGDYVHNPKKPTHHHQTIFVDFGNRVVTEVHDYENGKLTGTYSTGDQEKDKGALIFVVLVTIAFGSFLYSTTSLVSFLQ